MKMNKINCIFWKTFPSCRYIVIYVDLFSISIDYLKPRNKSQEEKLNFQISILQFYMWV